VSAGRCNFAAAGVVLRISRRRIAMAKGQMRPNKEKKKPKADHNKDKKKGGVPPHMQHQAGGGPPGASPFKKT
jgi:hypothetical protein